jgi:hypothetical protein
MGRSNFIKKISEIQSHVVSQWFGVAA